MRVVRGLLGALALGVALLGSGCGEEPADEVDPETGASAPGELAQPPSAGAPRAAQPGFAPDTMWAEASETETPADQAPATSELSVDSIVGQYRNHYAAGQVDVAAEGGTATQAEIEEEAKRRTALDFGYVEMTAWSDMIADLTEAQRAELTQRIEQANRELRQAVQREDPDTER